ncbi:hypothetical protein O3P69_007482 [Scylla paramamosain]|uniref:Secreted protein n=1 Tax=Scylla paramamosain TaxID=85552 RepID=A0AAW0V3R6_SCYPA
MPYIQELVSVCDVVLLACRCTGVTSSLDTRWRAATERPRQAREGLGARWGSLIIYGNRLGPCYRRPSYPEEERSLIIRKIDHSPSPGDDRLADWGGICFLSYSNDPRRRPQGCARPRLGLSCTECTEWLLKGVHFSFCLLDILVYSNLTVHFTRY